MISIRLVYIDLVSVRSFDVAGTHLLHNLMINFARKGQAEVLSHTGPQKNACLRPGYEPEAQNNVWLHKQTIT